VKIIRIKDSGSIIGVMGLTSYFYTARCYIGATVIGINTKDSVFKNINNNVRRGLLRLTNVAVEVTLKLGL